MCTPENLTRRTRMLCQSSLRSVVSRHTRLLRRHKFVNQGNTSSPYLKVHSNITRPEHVAVCERCRLIYGCLDFDARAAARSSRVANAIPGGTKDALSAYALLRKCHFWNRSAFIVSASCLLLQFDNLLTLPATPVVL